MEELQAKVLREKYVPLPLTVNKQFSDIIQKCLMKKPENRPTIEEIIFAEIFQSKAKVNRITLPLSVNKDKIIQKLQSNQQIKIDDSIDKLLSENIRASELLHKKEQPVKKIPVKPLLLRSSTSIG